MKYRLLLLFFYLLPITPILAQYRHLSEKDMAVADQIALEKLSQSLKFKTIANLEKESIQAEAFLGLHTYLVEAFPLLHKQLNKEVINNYSLLYTWPGKNDQLKPILISAHMDIVPVEKASEQNWQYAPYEGVREEGYVWGRGSLDDKYRVIAIMEAVERLLEEGFVPERTIYLAFGHDEEIGGQEGAAQIAAHLSEQNVLLAAVYDEGLAVAEDVLPGVNRQLALIGTASKGNLNLKLTVTGEGGHSSVPPVESTIGILSNALRNIELNPFKARLTPTTRQTLEIMSQETGGKYGFAVRHYGLFKSRIIKFLSQDPATDALIRTKATPTVIEAGEKFNVMPRVATAVVNVRILNGEDSTSVMQYINKVIDDKRVKVETTGSYTPPSPITPTHTREYTLLKQAIYKTFPDALTVPALFPGATDSQHYSRLTQNMFRFAPQVVNREKAKLIHNVNERISEEVFTNCITFYQHLILLNCSPITEDSFTEQFDTASSTSE